jgi:cytochrome P450
LLETPLIQFTFDAFLNLSRLCLGQQFAMIEQRVLLAMILQRYTWTISGDADALTGNPKTSSGVLLHPDKVSASFKRRLQTT